MEIFVPEEGEIPGAQSGGEVGVGGNLLQKEQQLIPGERAAFSGWTGEDKFCGGGFRAGDYALSAVTLHRLLQAQLQTAPGQGTGDEGPAVRGMGGEGFGEKEGDSQPGEFWGEQTDQFDI